MKNYKSLLQGSIQIFQLPVKNPSLRQDTRNSSKSEIFGPIPVLELRITQIVSKYLDVKLVFIIGQEIKA